MDEQVDILLSILGAAGVVLIAVIGWIIKRVLKVEDNCGAERAALTQSVAVLEGAHGSLRDEFNKEMKRNAIDHEKIMDRLDAHNTRVMTRLDSLLKIARNGGK
jgi:hypothetical protein